MRRISAIVSAVRTLTLTSIEIELRRLDGLPFPKFLPGQYATISFPAYRELRGERAFSIVSPPTKLQSIRFGVRTHGKYTSTMRGLCRGDTAMVGGPFGKFTYNPNRNRNAVFIAGGIGVTPFISMIRFAADQRLANPITLLYSVRSLDDAAYREELEAITRKSPNIRVVYAVTNETMQHVKERIVPGYISRELLWWAMGNTAVDQSLFLCGPKPFMNAMQKEFATLGVPRSRIRTEQFSAGSSELIERATPIPKIALAAWGTVALLFIGAIARIEQAKRVSAAVVVPGTIQVPIVQQSADDAQKNVNTAPSTPQPSKTPQAVQNTTQNTQPTQQRQQPSTPTYRTVVVPRTRMS